jgi:hypothetical protein
LAGAGFKTFVNGNVLLASEVNTFMMEQQIMVFAGTAARGSAIASPTEGMFAFLKDTDTLTFYTALVGEISNGCRRFQRVRGRGNP